MAKIAHTLMELHKITEWRNGRIYATEYVKDVWIPFNHNGLTPENHTYVSLSTARTKEMIEHNQQINKMIEE